MPLPHTIRDARAALTAGRLTARDLVEASLANIEAHNPRTNAFIAVHTARARGEADDADRARRRGAPVGVLHGIPISIKDLIDAAGDVTTAGSRVLVDWRATRDATIVTRLTDAGAIIIGRTNLHEFALGTTSEDSAYGPVRHPADAQRSAGGSSGGSAVAVATGMGLGSIGTDTGGSVRIPAAVCGLVGLKPSAGDVPLDGVIPLSPSLDHVGPLARDVIDAATLYSVLAGVPHRDVSPVTPSRIRVTRLTGYFSEPLEAGVRASIDRAVDRIRQSGAPVADRQLPDTDTLSRIYVAIVLAEAATWHARYLDDRPDHYTEAVRDRLLMGREISAIEYIGAQDARLRLRAAVDGLLADADVLLLPTLPLVAPPLGADTVAFEGGTPALPVRAAMLKHTQPFNLSGHPAITLPVATTGLPVGIQLVGRRGETRRLLDIAAGLEPVITCP